MFRCVTSRSIRGTICHRANAFRLARCVSPVPALPNRNPHAPVSGGTLSACLLLVGMRTFSRVGSVATLAWLDARIRIRCNLRDRAQDLTQRAPGRPTSSRGHTRTVLQFLPCGFLDLVWLHRAERGPVWVAEEFPYVTGPTSNGSTIGPLVLAGVGCTCAGSDRRAVLAHRRERWVAGKNGVRGKAWGRLVPAGWVIPCDRIWDVEGLPKGTAVLIKRYSLARTSDHRA